MRIDRAEMSVFPLYLNTVSREVLVTMIESYITYYNTKQLQRRLGVLTPVENHELYFAA